MKWVDSHSDSYDPLEQVVLNTKLRDAVVRGEDPLVVRQLVDNGAQVNPANAHDGVGVMSTPLLHVAARLGRPTVVEVLAGADRENVDIRDMFGRNALHVSALEGNRVTTHVLMQMGLDPMAKDKLGFTPVDLAQARGHSEALNILCTGKNVTLRDDVEALRAEVAVAYPQSEQSHVQKLRSRKDDGPDLPGIPIR